MAFAYPASALMSLESIAMEACGALLLSGRSCCMADSLAVTSFMRMGIISSAWGLPLCRCICRFVGMQADSRRCAARIMAFGRRLEVRWSGGHFRGPVFGHLLSGMWSTVACIARRRICLGPCVRRLSSEGLRRLRGCTYRQSLCLSYGRNKRHWFNLCAQTD